MPTVFSDVVLRNHVILAGVRGKNMRRNSRVMTQSGLQSTNIVWTQTLRQYEIGIIPLSRTDWKYLEQLHEVTEGGAYGFLMEDPKDNQVDAGEGVAQALTSTTFQLYKRYKHSPSNRYHDRKITRLDADTFALDGALTGTLDPDTGIVTILSAPDAEDVTWTAGRFYVPVQFMDDNLDWEIVGSGQTADARFVAGPNVVLQEVRE